MVEVSGQTGLVRDMGLRMTKLNNYQGQTVFIPNRNIAIAGKYIAGALTGYVDISLAGKDAVRTVKPSIRALLVSLERQYEHVFLSPSHIEPLLGLKNGEHYLRIHICIWPGQVWVVDQQLIPRLKQLFAEGQIPIAGDRISAFYHVRQDKQMPSISDRFRSLGKKRRDKASGKTDPPKT